MKPCEVDALRVHELMTTFKEDGTCQLTHQGGEIVELNLTKDIITKALRLQEENYSINSMKLRREERLLAFKSDKSHEGVYGNLQEVVIKQQQLQESKVCNI